MENEANDMKIDPSRRAHEDATGAPKTGTGSHSRLNKIADEAAGRGMARQHRDDQGVITESDPHGTNTP